MFARRRTERGASLVEGAIVSPIFLVLVLGIFEFGLAFRDYITLTAGTRSAARSASVAGRALYADYDILQAIRQGTQGFVNSADIVRIVIFKATGPEATLANSGMAGCLNGPSSTCNSYVEADLNRPRTDFGCGGSSPDRFWCPSGRSDRLSGPPDFIGIHIAITHHNPTGMFGATKGFDDEVVMRIEPTAL